MTKKILSGAVLLALSGPVCASGLFVEAGLTTKVMPPDKLYHQKGGGFPTESKMQTPSGRIGWEQSFYKHVSGRVALFGLGKSDIHATTGNEPCFDTYGASAYASCPKVYNEEYHTTERVSGGSVTAVFHTALNKQVAYTFEVGPTVVKQAMWLDQSNWPDHQFTQDGKGKGYMVAVGVRYEQHLTFTLHYYNWNSTSNTVHSELFGITKAYGFGVGYQY